MSHIPVPADEQLAPEAKEILDEIEKQMGRRPNLFRTYAHHPPLLRANWEKLKAVMMQGALSRRLKETIALLVSADNGCEYCVHAHSGALKALGVDDATLEAIRNGELERADFDAKERELVGLMRKANRAPHEVSQADFEKTRNAGTTDAELIEAYGVLETFVAFNKFLDSVAVDIG
jgi:uncharacterized peroxidase-related enzyme